MNRSQLIKKQVQLELDEHLAGQAQDFYEDSYEDCYDYYVYRGEDSMDRQYREEEEFDDLMMRDDPHLFEFDFEFDYDY